MANESPASVLFSRDGYDVVVTDGYSTISDQPGIIAAGKDGSTARFINVNGAGQPIVVGAGTAGTPNGGILSVQGVVGGTAIPVSVASLPIPTGAATETTLATLLLNSTFTSRINTLGQKTMANSTPVVISSDQSAINITGSATVSGTVTSNQGTAAALSNAWPILISDGTNTNPLTNAAPVGNEQALVVRNIPSGTQVISGTVSATVSGTVTANQGTPASLSNPWPVQLSNGTNTPIITNTTPGGSDQALVVRNIPSGTQAVSGTITANAGTGTFTVAGLGTAGSPSGGILTVQGASGVTPLSIGGTTSTTSPSWGDAQLRPLSLTLAGALRVDGSGVTQPVSAASLPLPAGAATETTLATLLTNSTFTGRINTLGQKTMANSTPVTLASDQSVIPVSDNGGSITIDNAALSVVGGGTQATALRVTIASDSTGVVSVDDNGGSLTVDGTVTANAGTGNFTVVQATASNLNAQVVGPGASGAAVVGNPVRVAGSDGSNTRNILTDTSGRTMVVGAAASGAAVTGNPILVSGSDGTNARTLRTETTGTLIVKEQKGPTSSVTSVASSASNVTILASNASRLGATIYNDSNQELYLKLGATASTTSFTVKMNKDDYYEIPFGYTGVIHGIWTSANGFARITEIT